MAKHRTAVVAILATMIGVGIVACNNITAARTPAVATNKSAISQSITVGNLRALITNTLYGWKNKSICWGPNTAAQILNKAETLAIIDERDVDWSGNAEFQGFLSEFRAAEGVTSVFVEHTEAEVTTRYLVIPDTEASGDMYTLEIGPSPQEGWTCVECTEWVGQNETGPNCMCEMTINVVCGENPSVSCVSECSYCSTEGVASPAETATIFCGVEAPFADQTDYSALAPGSSFNP